MEILQFFDPKISDLHNPYLLPDMEKAVNRILTAREKSERIVIFGDYDVDGVSSTALLVKFLTEIGCLVSYRLPHRVHDGYGLKDYFSMNSQANESISLSPLIAEHEISDQSSMRSLSVSMS